MRPDAPKMIVAMTHSPRFSESIERVNVKNATMNIPMPSSSDFYGSLVIGRLWDCL